MTIHEIKPVIFTNMILFRSALVLNPENLQTFFCLNVVPIMCWDVEFGDVVRHLLNVR